MLSTRTRMFKHIIDYFVRATEQPAALLPEFDCVDYVVAFEDKYAPGLRGRWLACLGWFMIFEGDLGAFDAVGVLR